MIEQFLIPFVIMLTMEFADKTQLLILSISTKSKKKIAVFIGAMIGFLLADGLMVYFGDFITSFLPITLVTAISGVIFIGFGVYGYSQEKHKTQDTQNKNSFHKTSLYATALLIFLGEIGDKSQLGSLLLGTTYNPHLAFFGIMAALATLTIITMLFGTLLLKYINKRKVERISNTLFVVVGMITLLSIIL